MASGDNGDSPSGYIGDGGGIVYCPRQAATPEMSFYL